MGACLCIRHSSHLLTEFHIFCLSPYFFLPLRFRFCAATPVEPVINGPPTKATKEGSGSGGERCVTRFSRACALCADGQWRQCDMSVVGCNCGQGLYKSACGLRSRKFQFMNFTYYQTYEVMSLLLERIWKFLLSAEVWQ